MKHCQYEFKDANRTWWIVNVVQRSQTDPDSETGYFETEWRVIVRDKDNGRLVEQGVVGRIDLIVTTQYDEPVKPKDIAKAMLDYWNSWALGFVKEAKVI